MDPPLPVHEEPGETALDGKGPQSLDESLDAQAEALAASFPADTLEGDSQPSVKSEAARHRANQAEIDRLVNQLPDRLRDQMDQLFRARYTRIQKLNLEDAPSDSQGNP